MRNIKDKKLLISAKKADFKSVKKILEDHTNLDLDCTDEAGKTLLHYAANSGQVDIVQMAIQHTLTLDATDKAGQAPIHYAVKQGYVAILKLLVENGAKVDFADKQKERTALHYAVYSNKVKAAEYLVCAGASQTVKDIDGKTPSDLCRSEEMRMTLNNSSACNKRGGRKVRSSFIIPLIYQTEIAETKEIYEGSKTTFKHSGLIVEYIKTGKGDYFCMLCRRTTTENSGIDFVFQEKEEVMSDVFVYRINCNTDSIPSILSVPLFSRPDKKEELIIRTNEDNEFVATDVEENTREKAWTCKFKADLKTFSAFVAVSRPKRETFEIGTEATTVHSTVDERVEISIPENAFEEPTKLTLEITKTPDMSETQTEDIKDIISATSFYSVNTEGGKPTNMEKEAAEEEQDEACWSVLDLEANVINSMVVFYVASFSVKVGVESFSRKSDANELKRQVSYLYRKSRRNEYGVMFLMLMKRIGQINTWKVVIECCQKEKSEERQKHWETKLYEKLESKLNDSITALSKQKYRVKLSEFLRVVGITEDMNLQFHPKRDNFQQFKIQIDEERPSVNGGLEIIQLPSQLVSARGDQNTDEEKLLSRFEFKLERILQVETNITTDHERRKEVSPSNDNFLSDRYMTNLVVKLKHSWFPVIILMGVSFTEIEKVLATEEDLLDKLTLLVLDWRDTKRAREDAGVPIIVSALSKVAFGLSKDLRADLKNWHDRQTDHDDPFYRWLKKAYLDSNLLNPGDYAKPMSDSYLAIISTSLEPTLQTAQVLHLTEEEHKEVVENKCYINDRLKVMKLLVVFRNSSPSLINGLESLIQALQTLNKTQARKWAVMCACSWVKQTTDPEDSFRTEVNELMKKFT
ncbi:hypothetical protein ACJMK2_015426 [Sinanodonta woodiana]|uniref:Death domain-containing protein n=1 Tax=Sinanodonta woodiana TaxID=1069815 RepID=A0ABD3UQA2_SINWO